MAISDVSSNSFATELMRLSLSIVWKNHALALACEPSGVLNDVESYIAARNGELNFYTVARFHDSVLRAALTEQEYAEARIHKKYIPESKRATIVALEQDYIVNYWENEGGEPNNYYRMLYGLPPKEATTFVYNTRYADIDMTTPIHLLPYTDRLKLESLGYIDTLLENNTDGSLEYLKYIGKYRIYPYIARMAEPFEMLYMETSSFATLRKDFVETYEAARRMIVRVYYTDAYRNKDELYEGFLGLCILFNAQTRMCSKYIETNITRDFYDLESLKLVYDAYGMPFYASIPLTYHQQIVKRMNELIAYKGSTQVFYDIFKIFDFGTMDVFEYFLVKKRLVDVNGNPIFRDVYGRKLSDRQLWNIRFARISWKDDKFVEVTNPDNLIAYNQLTEPDPYWVEDEDLKNKLYSRDWNYFHSKYMGIQIMFEITKLVFETCYFLRMIEDNRGTTKDIKCYYMVTGEDIPLFDMVVYAVALLCRNAGYTGEITADPASVAAVYGFNFMEYNSLLKMGTMSMDDFVKDFKQLTYNFIDSNMALAADDALKYWVGQITDGAFEYLGDDFPFGQAPYAPPPMFLRDFVPTRNSVNNLKEYLSQTIAALKTDDELVDLELRILYQKFVTNDDFVFQVRNFDQFGNETSHINFLLQRYHFTDEDIQMLRQAITASYEQMLAYIIKLINTREALTFDPYILELIGNMNINNLADVEMVYSKIDELSEYLSIKIQRAKTRTEYDAYCNIRKILMTTHLMKETFAKANGSTAATYEDMLLELNPTLWQRLRNEDIDLDAEEQYVIQTFMNLCDRLTLLQAMNVDNFQRIIEYILKILKFLKSAKIDLVDFETIYLITERSLNYIKFIAEIWSSDIVDASLFDKFYLYDKIHIVKIFQILESRFGLDDPNLSCFIEQIISSGVHFTDDYFEDAKVKLKDSFQYWFAWLSDIMISMELEHDHLPLVERKNVEVEDTTKDAFRLSDDIDCQHEHSLVDYQILLDHIHNYFRCRIALIDRMCFEKDGIHVVHVYQENVNDAIMWHDCLIKADEIYLDS